MTITTPRIPVTAPLGIPMGGFTANDWEAWSEANEIRIELVDGSLRLMAPPTYGHQLIISRIMAWLLRHGVEAELLNAGSGVIVERGVRVPDLMVLAREQPARSSRFPGGEIAVIVEVESPSTFREDRTAKRDDYEQAGVPTYWLIAGADDPDNAMITVHQRIGGVYHSSFRPLADMLAEPPAFA